MSSTKYTYTKITSPDTLEYQIRNSAITTSLDYIVARSSDVDIWFKATLPTNDESILSNLVNTHIPIPLLSQGNPKDPDGAMIIRPKAAKAGWAYQLHAVDMATSSLNAGFNCKLNPVTRLITPTNFVTSKFYDANGTQLTEPPQMANAVFSVFDWCPTHEIELIGGKLAQTSSPSASAYLWMHMAPGILNYAFIEGGLDLMSLGKNQTIYLDGRAAKYLHPSIPMPGINRFRFTIKHDPGLVHKLQCLFEFFKPVP